MARKAGAGSSLSLGRSPCCLCKIPEKVPSLKGSTDAHSHDMALKLFPQKIKCDMHRPLSPTVDEGNSQGHSDHRYCSLHCAFGQLSEELILLVLGIYTHPLWRLKVCNYALKDEGMALLGRGKTEKRRL